MALTWSMRKRMAWLWLPFSSYFFFFFFLSSALDLYQQERGKGKAKMEYTIAIDNMTSDKEEVMHESNPGSITCLSPLDITIIQRFDPF